jgi:hypothetical protein
MNAIFSIPETSAQHFHPRLTHSKQRSAGFPDISSLVRSQAEAKKLPVGSKVAMTCKTCRALDVKTVDGRKTFLAWRPRCEGQRLHACLQQVRRYVCCSLHCHSQEGKELKIYLTKPD